jgi:hypothetical protein
MLNLFFLVICAICLIISTDYLKCETLKTNSISDAGNNESEFLILTAFFKCFFDSNLSFNVAALPLGYSIAVKTIAI